MITEQQILDSILRRLKRLETQTVPAARRNKIGAWNLLDNGVAAGPAAVSDQSAAINDVAARAILSGHGGRLFSPATTYTINDGVAIAENRAIVIEGELPGWRSSFGRGTLWKRRANPAVAGQPMIQCLGSDVGDSQRALIGIRKLQLDGGFDAGVTDGEGIQIQRGQENPLEDVRLYNFPKTALRCTQVFNETWRGIRITSSGDGTADAAFHIGAAGTPGNADGTITLDIFGLQMESNRGTDLKVTGNPVGSGHPSTEINIIGGKWEGGVGTVAPYHHWEFAELVNVVGIGIFCHREVAAIKSEHLVLGAGEDRGVTYTGCWFEQAADISAPAYFINHLGGALHFVNCTFKMTPGIAYASIGAAARAGSITFTGCTFLDIAGGAPTKPIAVDNRAAPEFETATVPATFRTAPAGGVWIPFTTTPGYAANFSDVAGTPLEYRIALDGQIQFRGRCNRAGAGAANDAVGTLPAGFRPAVGGRFVCAHGTGQIDINIATNGAVTTSTGATAATLIDFTGIRFYPT